MSGRGVTSSRPTRDDMHGVEATIVVLRERPNSLIFTNLLGFNALYGHRRDPIGYSNLLAAFDARPPTSTPTSAPPSPSCWVCCGTATAGRSHGSR